jgi:phosphoserine aminotransferase
MTRAMNFNAGPAALPLAALERAQRELVDFDGSGMSVMEHSHRGKVYERVHHEALGLVRELLGLDESWDVLFLQGGATQAFAQIPMNFLPAGKVADYVVTGAWGEKAVSEARACAALGSGAVNVAATTATTSKAYERVPKKDEIALTEGAAYVHVTSNETVHGVEWALGPATPFPTTKAPLVCDMSSDILGRVVDPAPFSLIYAGAQKNVGPSGVTIVCARKELLAAARADIPSIFQYRTHAANDSLYNTPPTFGIYLVRNTLSWLKSYGGVPAIEKRNREKARVLYDAIDGSKGFYRCPVDPPCRSIMNVVWRLPTPELEAAFLEAAAAEHMVGLKGHRSVGGIRASIYNAAPLEWVTALVHFMNEFAKRRG